MSEHRSSHHGHHLRFYIVLITLVVGGIFFLLLMNNGDSSFSITSAIVNEFENRTFEVITGEDRLFNEFADSRQEIDLKLNFDRIPFVEKEVRIRNMEVIFEDLETKINVNDDILEINNVNKINLKMEDFLGTIYFDEVGLSLDGKVKRLGANDVAFSSKEDMKISFTDLDYNFLNLDGLELDDVQFSPGNGDLVVGEKLTYKLEEDMVTLYVFQGQLVIDKINATSLFLEGVVKAVQAGGELNLDLR